MLQTVRARNKNQNQLYLFDSIKHTTAHIMEHEYFNFDLVPNDIWRLIFKQLKSLTSLRSFNSINKSCHNSSKYYLQRERLWFGLYKTRFGLTDETNFVPSLLPSKLFQLKQMLRPSLNIKNNNINLDAPLKIVVIGDGKVSTKVTHRNGMQIN
jgi:hypothetical protein